MKWIGVALYVFSLLLFLHLVDRLAARTPVESREEDA